MLLSKIYPIKQIRWITLNEDKLTSCLTRFLGFPSENQKKIVFLKIIIQCYILKFLISYSNISQP